jgi:uncharacterized protein
MFPLGTVLFPGVALPLHVFEQRYRQLARDCLAGDRELGIVLIERGSEVGGDDVRTGHGTLARIARAAELPDGRWFLLVSGEQRIEVLSWLEDDPYPRARVRQRTDGGPGDGLADLVDEVTVLLRRALALASELGESTVPATLELSDEPVAAGYQAAAAAPIGPLDKHGLLALDDPDERTAQLRDLLAGSVELLEARLLA